MSKRYPIAGELELMAYREVIALSQQAQQLSAQIERVFQPLCDPSKWEDTYDGWQSAELMSAVRNDCVDNLRVMKQVLKNAAKAVGGKI